jgi:hypothetical protein
MTDRPDLREIISVIECESTDMRRYGFTTEEADRLAGAAYFMRTIERAGDRGRDYLKNTMRELLTKHGKHEFQTFPFLEHVYDFSPTIYQCAQACAEASLRFRVHQLELVGAGIRTAPDERKLRDAECCVAALNTLSIIDKDLKGFRTLEVLRPARRQKRMAA